MISFKSRSISAEIYKAKCKKYRRPLAQILSWIRTIRKKFMYICGCFETASIMYVRTSVVIRAITHRECFERESQLNVVYTKKRKTKRTIYKVNLPAAKTEGGRGTKSDDSKKGCIINICPV
jgi:hypothetical protein